MNVKIPMFYAVNITCWHWHGHYCESDCVYKHKILRGLLFKVLFLTILTSGYLTGESRKWYSRERERSLCGSRPTYVG
jgi:hypothetical protein